MHRRLSSVIPIFVAAAAVVLMSPLLHAQQNHDHAADHACACCGESGSGSMNHASGSGCCQGQSAAMPMAGGDKSMMADMELFHFLFENRSDIRRTVRLLPNGIDTVTESEKPEIAAKIKAHVAAMYARLKDGRPIHQRDPLFAELFAHADQIDAVVSATPNGVHVVETSDDPAVARLLHRHAAAVDGFISNGMAEMMKNHLE
jgi:uncharacterized protein